MLSATAKTIKEVFCRAHALSLRLNSTKCTEPCRLIFIGICKLENDVTAKEVQMYAHVCLLGRPLKKSMKCSNAGL